MDFLCKHVLFPRKYGIQPYFYLAFLLPTLAGLSGYSRWMQLTGLGCVVIFLKAYRDAYDGRETLVFRRSFAIQMLIVLFLGVNPWFQTWGLQIFTGFEIGFWKISQSAWRRYLAIYYAVAAVTFVAPFLEFGVKGFDQANLVWIIVGIIFILFSPFFSKMVSRTYDTEQQNKALEARVRQLERERIAYDLHDNLGQSFSTIALQAELAEKLVDKKPDAAKTELTKIAGIARASLTQVREIVTGLRQPESIEKILADSRQALDIAGCQLTVEGDGTGFDSPFPEVLKEALTNVVRHSEATEVRVIFASDEAVRQLTVADNGVGLADSVPSHGLTGMRKRVEQVGGELTVLSAETGTTIEVRIAK